MIKLNRLTDYAVALLAQMACKGKSLWSASDLAERTGFPQPTVSKILKKLTKSGVVIAHRGAMGGYRLGGAPHEITFASIVEAMDGPIAITDCAQNDDSHLCSAEAVCPMQGRWAVVNRAIRKALSDVTLRDVAEGAPHNNFVGTDNLGSPSHKSASIG